MTKDNTITVPLKTPNKSSSAWLDVHASGLEFSSVSVSPLVLFSILDHQTRRKASQSVVYGGLLGYVSNETHTLQILNSFPLNTTVDENDADNVIVDEEYFDQILSLHQRVNRKEVFVGWYSTAKQIGEDTNVVHGKIASLTPLTKLPLVHLLVDAQSLTSLSQISAKSFVGTELKLGDAEPLGYLFEELPCNTIYLDGDKSALDLILKTQEQPDLSAAVTSELESLESSMRKISELLDSIQTYVQDVVDGKKEAKASIGRYLMDTFHIMPQLNPADFEKLFHAHLQDLLMVVYLANLTRSQLAISERLHQMG